MTVSLKFTGNFLSGLLWVLTGMLLSSAEAQARQFSLSGVPLSLQEVTTNVDVYYTAMRYNRAANEWDVNVTVSNKMSQPQSGPMVLLVDSYTGTSGPLRADGVSSNQAFYDLSGELAQGKLSLGGVTVPRVIAMGFTPGQTPSLVTRVFAGSTNNLRALAFTRTLNQVGQPLAGVAIAENGPDGGNTNASDGTFGVVTLGNSPGDYTWEFSLNGYLPVWRREQLQSNTITMIPYPRLTAIDTQTYPLSPLSGGVVSNQSVQVQVGGGAISQSTSAQLTILDGQSLPAFLPQGWSPLQAFWLQFASEPTLPVTATVTPFGTINPAETAALAQFNTTTLTWQVLQLVAGNGTNAISVSLPGSGAYALVAADIPPIAPPVPTVGSVLPASTVSSKITTNLVASAIVTPGTSPASVLPQSVTAIADISITNVTGSLPSGAMLHDEVSESFLLEDGSLRVPPLFDNYIVGYQRPSGASPGTLHAQFQLRPVLLLGPDQLNQATIHVDVFAPEAFSGGVFDTNGGLMESGAVRVLAGPGVFSRQEGVELLADSTTNFTGFPGTNYPVAAAFELAVNGVLPGQQLTLEASGIATNATFVLGRVIDQGTLYGVSPVERMHSDGNGNLFSDEPTNADHLSGLTGSGQYVLLQVQPVQGLVEGVADNSSGQPSGGLPVGVAGQPWLAFSAANGSYQLLAPSGAGKLTVSDLASGDTGAQSFTMPPNLAEVATNVESTVSQLTVQTITPADNSTNVSLVTSVVVNFSRTINPATFTSNSVQLIEAGQVVAANVSLDLADMTVTLLPTATLDPGGIFQVVVSTNIADTVGRALSGQSVFTFATTPESQRDSTAELVIYQPGATNLPTNIVAKLPGYQPGTNASDIVVQGTPGVADPGVAVIIANESSGETTTVTSQPDGSFVSFISGQQQDFISATFISLNGARLYVPVNRQVFDDGSIGLYTQGGAITAMGDGGAIQMTVPPNAIQSRTIFKLNSVNVPELQQQLDGTMPTNGTIAGGALNLNIQGQPPTLPVQLSFPVELISAGYPTNEPGSNAAAVAVQVTSNQNVTAFQVMGQMTFVPQSTKSRLPPSYFPKTPFKAGGGEPVLYGSLNVALQLSPIGFQAQFLLNTVLAPLLFGPLPVTIKGTCAYIPEAEIYEQEKNAINAAGAVGGVLELFGLENPLFAASVIADYALDQKELSESLPLSGAFVTLTQTDGPLVQEPGRLFPGMVYCTSGANGTFLTCAPQAGANYLMTASHPLFADPLTIPVNPVSFNPFNPTQLSLAGVVYKQFYFSIPAAINTAPTVSIGALPTQPAAGQPCTIVVTATQPTGPPTIGVKLMPTGKVNLLNGKPVPNAQVTLTKISNPVNGNTTTWNGTLTSDSPVAVNLAVVVQSKGAVQLPNIPYEIDFTGQIPVIPGKIPPPPKDDVNGPVVVEADPPDNGLISGSGEITVTFNKPIDAFVTNHLAGISLSGTGITAGNPISPILQLSSDQTALTILFPGLQPSGNYQLTLSGNSIRDLAAQPLNQSPGNSPPASFTTTFRTPAAATGSLTEIFNGRGAVISGTQLYAIDQSANQLFSYDISTPTQPLPEAHLHLIGQPRDIIVVPQYTYKLNAQADFKTSDLVVVVGGNIGSQTSQNTENNGESGIFNVSSTSTTVSGSGQYLWVVDMSDPLFPTVLASPIVTFRDAAVVPKVRWSPPYLVYQEYGPDLQQLVLVNLQSLIYGYNSTAQQQSAFPYGGRLGSTTNADGSYNGKGDILPVPQQDPAEFFGYTQSYVLQGTTQPILDFSAINQASIIGVTLRNGLELDQNNVPNGVNLSPMYRTFSYGAPLNFASPTDGALFFGKTAYPRWVTELGSITLLVKGAPSSRALALVSLSPDSDNVEKLAVIDISLPETPTILNEFPIPSSLSGGDLQSASVRSDGMIEVAGTQNLIVLNPYYLAATNIPDGQLSPAIIDVISGAGGIQRSGGTSTYGIHAVADNGHAEVVQSAPEIQFVNFPQSSALVNPTTLNNQTDDALSQLFSEMQPLPALAPARVKELPSLNIPSDLAPVPNLSLHYYVLMQAPGSAGSTIDLGVEALNPAGWPLSNLGAGFAPVRAISPTAQTAIGQTPRPSCGSPIRALTAYRVSKNPNSPYYNYYLSRPFAMITESISSADLATYQMNAGVDREILFGGFQLRAFIDPDQAKNPVIGPFAAQIDADRQLIYPISVTNALTVDRSYITGDNPPPPGSAAAMPGTFDAICAHSGELRTDATDLVLPSPRMPIEITREIGDQDFYEGPFGVSWDFNYNQRLTVLAPLTFPAGLQIPVVTRDTPADSVTAGSKDLLFHTGMGQTHVFQWKGTAMPVEYQKDPVVAQLGYLNMVSDYYLPAPSQGVFDLLVKFTDGRYERLTPDGTRYRYTPQGRLESIYDRYPANYHWLTYDSHGWLVRIDDHSVIGPRYVKFGYYRQQGQTGQYTDSDFTTGLDTKTSNPYLNGKICRLLDYAGRDVQFQYDKDGFLTNRLGIQVDGENGGFSGRAQTMYAYSNCKLVQVAATARGTPILSVNAPMNDNGKPVAQSTSGIGGQVQVNVPAANNASTLAGQVSAAGLGDGSTTQMTLDKFGNPASSTVTGADGTTAKTTTSYTPDGLLASITYPEGNSRTLTYDSSNPIFRSRANLLSVAYTPGPRGGAAYSETFQYDPSYNLKSGDQTDGNGFATTYQLSADSLSVISILHGSAGNDSFTFNANGQLTSSADIRGVTTTTAYDPTTGFRISRALGDTSHTYTFTYASDIPSLLGRPSSISYPAGAPIQFTYNNNLQPVTMQRDALVENMAYDELGHPTYHQTQLGDGSALVVESQYDAKGFLFTNLITGIKVNGQITSLEYDYTPDPLSRIASIHYPQGTLESFLYDARGNIINRVLGDYSETYTRDKNNNITGIFQGGDLVKSNIYDGFDRPITVIRRTGSLNQIQNTSYYPEGETQSQTVLDPAAGPVSQTTYNQIDEVGRPIHSTMAGTTITPSYSFQYRPLAETIVGPRETTVRNWNTAGYDTGLVDAIVNSTFFPDGNGRITQIQRQEDGATYDDFFTYDDLDHRKTTSDDLGSLFSYTLRANGDMLGATNADGHATSYARTVLGELLSSTRQDGMQISFQHDATRHVSFNGDPTAGFKFTYDTDLRLTTSTLRNGAPKTFGNFDPRNMPQSESLPGNGTKSMQYDLQRRMTNEVVNYQSTAYKIGETYDALDRVSGLTYQQDGSAANSASFTYDEAGPLLTAQFQEDIGKFQVQYSYYPDGSRQSVTYPSGATVTENRDTAERLTGISDAHGNILSAASWQGNKEPKVVMLGSAIKIVNTYDARGRVTGSRATRLSDGAVLTHLRYQYDSANNQQVRQFIHRNGKSDNLTYDTGERLTEAKIGTRPLTDGTLSVPWTDKNYSYQLAGLDYLTAATSSDLTPNIPIFATNWTAHDAFLLPTVVDGFNRGQADPMGNVVQALLQVRPPGASGTTPVPATLTNNGEGYLEGIARSDGVTELNFFQPNGLRYERQVVSQGGIVLDFRHFVYDDKSRLLEEYQQSSGTPNLMARYYYSDSDAPVAADLFNPVTGNLDRYYYLKDNMESVVAVADTNGNVIERVWYDPFGQPQIETRATQPPQLQNISLSSDGNSLLIALSESVWTAANDPGPGGGIIQWPTLPTNVLTISANSTNLGGALKLLPSLPGYAPYSVFQFTPSQPLPQTPSSLIGWWPGGNNAIDVAGGHNGSLVGGVKGGPGLIGQSFVLNGTSAYVSVPDNAALNVSSNDFTVALWVNFTNATGEQVLIEKYLASPVSGWSLVKLPNNSLQLEMGDGAGNEIDINSGVVPNLKTNWVHYAFRRQGGQITVFTNGVAAATGSNPANLSAPTPLLFGSRNGSSFFLNGSINEVTLYGSALTDGQITQVAGGVSVPGNVTVSLTGGVLADDWGNSNLSQTVSFLANTTPGAIFYDAEPAPTGAPSLARSSVGSPFLFHGQYFDYDTGLVYLRARFYDPYSGMFLQPDPLGYADSVNLYAAMHNNPAGYRDPMGLATGGDPEALGNIFKSVEHGGQEGTSELGRSMHPNEGVEVAGSEITHQGLDQVTHPPPQLPHNPANVSFRQLHPGNIRFNEVKPVTNVRLGIGKHIDQVQVPGSIDFMTKRLPSGEVIAMPLDEANDLVAKSISNAGSSRLRRMGMAFRETDEGLEVIIRQEHTKLHFNINGLEKHLGPEPTVEQVVDAAMARTGSAPNRGLAYMNGGGSVTQWELRDIQEAGKMQHVQFYRGNTPLANPYSVPVQMKQMEWSAGDAGFWEGFLK